MNLPPFKGQPWVVFDTIAARSFLVGENRQGFNAVGTNGPAITPAGEMVFFAAGRKRSQLPWYTNMDLDGQLSYGMRVWGVYILFAFPATPQMFNNEPTNGVPGLEQLAFGPVLAQAIIDYGIMEMRLGQEEQMDFPVSTFDAGGGFAIGGNNSLAHVQNGIPQGANVLTFAEPIDMSRTLNVNANIKIAPEVLPTIGTPALPGVGCELRNGSYSVDLIGIDGQDRTNNLNWAPYAIQCGLIGERIKDTQYGQLPPGMR